ncbi:fimbrial protein [Salmonella enterica]|uniref:fimbrial protein n=1 Tax=Salmonella enterica TaxID=28901 RepID=UPI0009B17F47|nr:type 1 fimbrial protein [Salmonella enterica]
MKIKNRLFLLGAAMAVMSSSAFAATNGTQTFTANVTANTCTIDDVNHTFNVSVEKGSISALQVLDHHDFKVSGCPASVNNVNVVFTYDSVGGAFPYIYLKNHGTASDKAQFQINTDGAEKNVYRPGVSKSFPVTGGTGVVPVYLTVNGSGYSNDGVTSGTVDMNASITFDFA